MKCHLRSGRELSEDRGGGQKLLFRLVLGPARHQAEPSRAGPGRIAPIRARTGRSQPSRAWPGRAGPSRAEPGRDVQSRDQKQSQDGPSFAGPICAETCPTEPIRTDKCKTEPRRAELEAMHPLYYQKTTVFTMNPTCLCPLQKQQFPQ